MSKVQESYTSPLQVASPKPRMKAMHIDISPRSIGGEQSVKVVIPELRIEAIPQAMRKMGWNTSAALMERWFASPAWRMPESWKSAPGGAPKATSLVAGAVDSSIVRMRWALTFDRCVSALAELRRRMVNPAAQGLIRERILSLKDSGPLPRMFGHAGMDVMDFDEHCQSNHVGLGSKIDPLDDMYGALGLSSLKVGLVGEIVQNSWTGRIAFHATHAGFYIRDNYDFNGAQPLGIWTQDRVLTKWESLGEALSGGEVLPWHGEAIGWVSNRHFDAYRNKTGKGGDFVIYSDVMWEACDEWIDIGPA